MALWGGRFEGKASPLFRRFNDSLRVDHRLVFADITGSKAWARAIHGAGVLSADELARLLEALDQIARDVSALSLSAAPTGMVESGEEDVHSWVEAELIRRVGDLGKKLHTGRSRNDQVATDFRLFVHTAQGELMGAVDGVRAALVDLAERELEVVIPGYTHLQRGQPVLFSHWALAYFEMFSRDADRLADARGRTAVCPLGSGALAGTAYPIDREGLARELGFDAASLNSLDAVSDRDFALETVSACVNCAVHLSRIAEDLIIFATSEFGFVTLDDSVSSGSSLMPQKKNPDSLELIRGKAGRVLGAHVALATTLKGLPLAYNKDMQEDKEGVFDALDTLMICLKMLVPVLGTLKVHREVCARAALGDGAALATDLADYLVAKGVPFRDAHATSGRLVRLSIETQTPLHRLSLDQMRSIEARIDADVYPALTLEASLARRDVLGGTAPARVAGAVRAARVRLIRR
ncbi:MAG: argininosuccinate lyase [Phycisphaerales bacterium]